jgi:hypothetical protein
VAEANVYDIQAASGAAVTYEDLGQGLVDGRARIEAVDLVEVDAVDPQELQVGLAGLPDVLARRPAHVGPVAHGEQHRGGDHQLVAVVDDALRVHMNCARLRRARCRACIHAAPWTSSTSLRTNTATVTPRTSATRVAWLWRLRCGGWTTSRSAGWPGWSPTRG